MITNEIIKLFVPKVARVLRKCKSEKNAMTNSEIRKRTGVGAAPTLRAIIHHIRVNQIVKRVCAGKKGYWIERSEKKLSEYVTSLQERAKEINQVARSLKRK